MGPVQHVPPGAFYATGKRKNAIARVWLFKGKGQMWINRKDAVTYLKNERVYKLACLPLQLLGVDGNYNVFATAKGGGLMGQAGAVKAGLSKALALAEPELKKKLELQGFLTRDARIKERKHYGHKRARKSFQFSKR